ncbi:MAG: aminotransferase class IV [Fodinibius sp.]|nr:aminotransferase class IV [Fodinibius sp.]
MANSNEWIVFDGNIIPADQPVVPAVSRGLMYGDGLFETVRTYEGQTLLFEDHLHRLRTGMNTLGINDISQLDNPELQPLVYNLLDQNNLAEQDAIVRLQVWRGGQRGYNPDPHAESHFSITTSAFPDRLSPPALSTVDCRRIPSEALPVTSKFTNGINYILAAREAAENGADDALMQTIDGWVSETTIANLFWAHGDTIFTPSDDCDLVPGITRQIVIELIRDSSNYQLKMGKYTLQEVREADIVWVCNSVRELLPVRSINEREFSTKSRLISDLQQRYKEYCNVNLKPLQGK